MGGLLDLVTCQVPICPEIQETFGLTISVQTLLILWYSLVHCKYYSTLIPTMRLLGQTRTDRSLICNDLQVVLPGGREP